MKTTLSLAFVAVMALACGDSDDSGSTAASGGSSSGGSSSGGSGGSSSAGTGGTSAGGTSAGGTSAGGTSAGGTSAGGTSAGGTSAGGSSATAGWFCNQVNKACSCIQNPMASDTCTLPKEACCFTFQTNCQCQPTDMISCAQWIDAVKGAAVSTCPPP